MFAGRNLCIATMHKKETVIAPVLQKELGVSCFTCDTLNTDAFGTFSGEVKREVTPLEAAKQKCLQAMAITGCDLAVSSEGSFGSHPVIGFLPCDEELLFFFDKKRNIEVVVKEVSTKTNFSGEYIHNLDELKNFSNRSQFPSHGMVVKDGHDQVIAKGIKDWTLLVEAFYKALAVGIPVKVETDMRAHQNPTRMSVIKTCAQKLAVAIKSTCPVCQLPGFIVVKSEAGLPCELCHLPTSSTLKHIKICKGCGHKQEILYPYQKLYEEPTYCHFCNP